jgi:hypothetical protein
MLDHVKVITEFPSQFLNLRTNGNPEDAQYWAPKKIMDSIPQNSFVPRKNPSKPDITILYHPHYPSNLGHIIGDDLFPLFNMMSSFGVLVNDAQLIISRSCDTIFKNNQKKIELCYHFMNMLIPGLSNKPFLAATQPDFGEKLGVQSDIICFENVITGIGLNSAHTPKKHRITVSIKNGKRGLANYKELISHLKLHFPNVEIDAIELRSLGSWKNELKYLQDTSVLITPCGGVSMSAMFLPHNSALIIVDYFNVKKNEAVGMEDRLWSNLGYIRPYHYPFVKEEVVLDPKYNRNEYQDMRDYGQVNVNLQRMTTIVQSALRHVENFMVMGIE